MKRFWMAVCAGLLLTGVGVDALAQSSSRAVGLKDLMREVLAKNQGLKAKQYEYESKRSGVIEAWLPEDPRVGVDVEGQSDLFDFDSRVDNEWMVEQSIPFPTKLFLKGIIASKEADRAYQSFKEEERSLWWHIEQPYYELYLAQKTLEALEENKSLLEQLLKSVKARYESNQASQDELLKIQIELSKNQIEIFDWKEKIHVQEAHFSHAVDESLETQYVVVNEYERPSFSITRPELEKLALAKRPELKNLAVAIELAKAQNTLSKTSWLPDLMARIETRNFKDDAMPREYDTFIGITVPVWSLIKGVGGGWKASEDQVRAAQAFYSQMKNEALLKVHEAYSKIKSAENALNVYENSILPQAKQQVEVALASYEAGKKDFLNVVDAQRTLKNTQIEYYRAIADYQMGLSDLRLAVGGEF
jgi:outer membrane protein TolC